MTRRVAASAVLVAFVTMLSCTNTDVLTNEPGQVSLVLQTEKPYEGEFEFASVQFEQVTVHPVDESASAALGEDSIAFVSGVGLVNLNLKTVAPVVLAPVLLNEGVYRVTQVSIARPSVWLGNTDPASSGDCRQTVTQLPRPGDEIAGITITDFPQDVTFRVVRGQPGTFTVIVNGRALADMLYDSFYCSGRTPVYTAPSDAEFLEKMRFE